jgi:hypothetical protein
MEKIKHTPGSLPVINPYVTTNGGVVILNGPFPIDQAHRVARLCKAAPGLLGAAKKLLEEGSPEAIKMIRAAIDKAEGK